MPIIMRIKGIEEYINRMMQLGEGMKEVAAQGVWDYAQGIMGESMEECPHDTGDLRRSNFIGEVEQEEMIIQLVMGYMLSYAIYVHEDLQAFHPNGGKAKFLEDPMMRYAPGFATFLATRLSDHIVANAGG